MVDASLDYNLLLGRNWMYSMQAIASSLFRVVCFPHNRKIVTIDQMAFKNPSITASSGASIPIIEHSQPATGSVGVGMYPSLMGSFSCPASILMIGSSSSEDSTSMRSVSFFHESYGRSLDSSYTEYSEWSHHDGHVVACNYDSLSS